MIKNKISVIIPTLNRSKDLRKCLDSIVKQALSPDEVIIVDQSSDELTKNLVAEFQQKFGNALPAFIYVHQEEKSSARARNLGATFAKGELISFTDDDIVLFPDYFEKIVPYFNDAKVGGVSGNVVNNSFSGMKWEFRKAIMKMFLLNDFKGKMTASGLGYPVYERMIDKVEEVQLFGGYSMTFRRELFMAEKFDNWFSGYSFREDVDLSYRISLKAKMLLVPDVKFYHYHSSTNRLDVFSYKKMQLKNVHYVFKKHRPQTFFYRTLFAYSMFGILFIDLMELVLSPSKDRLNIFKADLAGILALGKHND